MKKILALLVAFTMLLSMSTMVSFADTQKQNIGGDSVITLTNVQKVRKAVSCGYWYSFDENGEEVETYYGDGSGFEGLVVFDGTDGMPCYYVEEGAVLSVSETTDPQGIPSYVMLQSLNPKAETGSFAFTGVPHQVIGEDRFDVWEYETRYLSGTGTERYGYLYEDDSYISIDGGDSYTLTEGVWIETKPMAGSVFMIVVVPKGAAQEPVKTVKFNDVPAGSWYEAPVAWALANKITDGTSATTFSPLKECTRAHVLTFLWRAAGEPEAIPGIETLFYNDMTAGQYYCDPISWAVQNAIVEGVEPHTFGVNKPISRGEFGTYLWKAAGCPEPKSMANPFTDVPAGSAFEKAVLWAKEQGVTDGTSATTFSPDNICTRAHVVTFLSRAYGK